MRRNKEIEMDIFEVREMRKWLIRDIHAIAWTEARRFQVGNRLTSESQLSYAGAGHLRWKLTQSRKTIPTTTRLEVKVFPNRDYPIFHTLTHERTAMRVISEEEDENRDSARSRGIYR